MRIVENVLTDRGSRYAVSGGVCRSEEEAARFVCDLKRHRKFARATHHSWAFLKDGVAVRQDDGEAGAGLIIARMLERQSLQDHIVVVTRWYGGRPLGGDRFRHVQAAVRRYFGEGMDTGAGAG